MRITLTQEHKNKIQKALKLFYSTHIHHNKQKPLDESKVPIKYCKCGCGNITSISYRNRYDLGYKKGQRIDYFGRHALRNRKRPPFSNEWIENLSKSAKKRIGKLNPNWKGGKVNIGIQIRAMDEYNIWRKKVYERDGYKCVKCHTIGNGINLNADHIYPLSLMINKYNIKTKEDAKLCIPLWNISNGRTLCIKCHRKTDTYAWKIWNSHLRKIRNNIAKDGDVYVHER